MITLLICIWLFSFCYFHGDKVINHINWALGSRPKFKELVRAFK